MRWLRTPDKELNQLVFAASVVAVFCLFEYVIGLLVVIAMIYLMWNFGPQIQGLLNRVGDSVIDAIFRAVDDAPSTLTREDRYEQLKHEHPDYPEDAIQEQVEWEEKNPPRLGGRS
ncbi:hypothetical protein A2264_01900 [candidate division WWE3 bacterium RIFOXYA2_FULL_46_9]|uniref:Uncharacterized protein n=1 Tax=candidate division WWE3 bacterium RIFOXYA2_FULL_46_9 TaxID=1802636 RepID=A0A1F4W0Q4_UNCKA|nr:MAG: hypothetical protein A2264_01900 [candidate division WWE3 bacterium RIFOXYA2_FULL_46_9]